MLSPADDRRPRRPSDDSGVDDDRLRLIFTCCHPALVGRGAGRADAAHARRAHHRRDRPRVPRPRADDGAAARPRQAQDPQRRHPVPRAARRTCCPSAPSAVLAVLYLCSTRATPRPRAPTSCGPSLCAEAIRLGRTLAALMPDEPEALGLLALMLLHDAAPRGAGRRARRPRAARGPGPHALGHGRDRRRAATCSTPRCGAGEPGPYQVQAAIAACHATAPDAGRHRLGRDRRALRRARAA